MKPLFYKYIDKVIINDGECWGWSGAIVGNGYGMVKHPGNKTLYAHRASWEIFKGDIPEGMRVLHRCDNRECTNPDHLFLGTQSDNIKDMFKKGRNNWRTTRMYSDEERRERYRVASQQYRKRKSCEH